VRNIIETLSLTKRFSRSKSYLSLLRFRRHEDLTAVDAVSLQVREGELFGLLGPNGAGKTTLIKILCTLILPSKGRALVCGKDVVTEAVAVRPLIGLIDAQERSFFWRLSGRQNLQFFAALNGLRGTEAERRIGELLDLVGLSEHADRRFMNYSTGMRQRLAIARGLLSTPRVIFMDEPTRSLDPANARGVREFIRGTLVDKLGCTVLLVTHDLEEAEALCDRVAIMDHGQIIACGPVEQIKERIPTCKEYYLRVRGASTDVIAGLRDIPGVLQLRSSTGNPHGIELGLTLSDENEVLPLVMRSIVSSGGEIQHCHTQDLSLEEVFVYLTGGGQNGI
jgi:ABC-2 type transport system ATP-binding protein